MDLNGLTRYCDVSEKTLREWIHRAENPLPAVRVGVKILVRRNVFDRWLEAHTVTPADSIDVNSVVDEIISGLGAN
jgi:excisionase family DNA binding protein